MGKEKEKPVCIGATTIRQLSPVVYVPTWGQSVGLIHTTTIFIMTLLIMTLLIMTILITLNMGDITYNEITYNGLYL